MFPFNRTSLESKHNILPGAITHAVLLIEPVWNRNFIGFDVVFCVSTAFNRTSLESKLEHHLQIVACRWAFNRTSLESKRGCRGCQGIAAAAFNRTSLESKPDYGLRFYSGVALLIEPVWNRNSTNRNCSADKTTLLIEPVWNRNVAPEPQPEPEPSDF